jgi:DNA-binding transcriptional LysR family regulator
MIEVSFAALRARGSRHRQLQQGSRAVRGQAVDAEQASPLPRGQDRPRAVPPLAPRRGADQPGRRVLRKARNIVADIDALDQECAAIARGTAGLLRFGFHGSLGSGDLSAVVRDFRAACPDVELSAKERSRTRLLRGLERDQLDFAVMCGQAERPGITSLSFWSEQVMIGLAHGDPLCARAPLYWTDLRGMTFVISQVDPGPFLNDLVTSRLSGPGFGPSVRIQDVRRENLLPFAGNGSVVVTTGVARDGDHCVLCPVHDAFGPTHLEQAIHWRRDNRSATLHRFLEMLAQRYGRPLPSH